jgi:hypothetical protein
MWTGLQALSEKTGLTALSSRIASTSWAKRAIQTTVNRIPISVTAQAVRLRIQNYFVAKWIKNMFATSTSEEMGKALLDPKKVTAEPVIRLTSKMAALVKIVAAVFGSAPRSEIEKRIATASGQAATIVDRIGTDLARKDSTIREKSQALVNTYENVLVTLATNYTVLEMQSKELKNLGANEEVDLHCSYLESTISEGPKKEVAEVARTNQHLADLVSPETGYSVARALAPVSPSRPPLKEKETPACHYGVRAAQIASIFSSVFSPTVGTKLEKQVGAISAEVAKGIRGVATDLTDSGSIIRADVVAGLAQQNESIDESRKKQNEFIAMTKEMAKH